MASKVDKENTIRALRDQPLAVSSWKCRWGWHTWSRWGEPKADSYRLYMIQEAECIYCNTKRVTRLTQA
jgi:hypothetical protein